jgi:hypothetical protein
MHEFKFFQRGPIFVTLDGYSIYPNETFVTVNKSDIFRRGTKLPALTIVERWPLSKKYAENFKTDDTLAYFKHLENAKKYVKNNKLKSKNDEF